MQEGSLVNTAAAKQKAGLFGQAKKQPAVLDAPAAAATIHLTPVVKVN